MPRPPDVPFEAVNQAGTFTREQAYAEGLTRRQLRRRLASARWKVVAGDALAAAPTTIGPWQLAFAVRLTWPDAVISHQLAAALHHLPVDPHGTGSAITPRALNRRASGLKAHRLRLGPADIGRIGGLPVTTRQRTALDLLRSLPWDETRALWAWLLTRQVLTGTAVTADLDERAGQGGAAQLRRLLRVSASGSLSAAEDLLHALLAQAGITGWRANAPIVVRGRTIAVVDVVFARQRLVIEVDGYSTHSGREQFQRDRTRQNQLIAAGYTVLRYTWADLSDRPAAVAREIQAALAKS